MNRHQRRKEQAVQRKLFEGMVINTTTFRDQDGNFCWIEEPEDGITADTEIHGPFATEAEAEADSRLVILGPECVVTEGGVWDPAWDRLQ